MVKILKRYEDGEPVYYVVEGREVILETYDYYEALEQLEIMNGES